MQSIDANAELLPPEGSDLAQATAEKFAPVRKLDHAARLSFASGVAYMVLAGVELLRLKKELGVKHGGSRKKQVANICNLTWQETVEQHSGLSYRTAQNYILMAEAAKKRLPMLQQLPLLDTPILSLPQQQQDDLIAATLKLTDGSTAQQLMWDWGLAKKPQGSAATGGNLRGDGAGEATTLDPAWAAWLMVGEPIIQLANASHDPDTWTRYWYDIPLLDDEDAKTIGLQTLRNVLAEALQQADSAIKSRREQHLARIK